MLPERFWSKVDKSGDCWVWTGSRYPFGYGIFYEGSRKRLAHRVSFADVNGEIPEGLFVCHRCDNPPCVRPDHLFLGTTQENTRDRCRKGRTTKNNAKLSTQQVEEIRNRYTGQHGEISSIARDYGVTRTAIQWILSGGSWKDVQSKSCWSADQKFKAPPSTVTCIQNNYSGTRGEIAAMAKEHGLSKHVVRTIVRAAHPLEAS